MIPPDGPPRDSGQPMSPNPMSPVPSSSNPYAPPGATDGAPFTYGAMPRPAMPPEMTGVVSQLSWWMRFLSVVYYIGAGLVVLMVLGFLAMGTRWPGLPQPLFVTFMAMFAIFAVVGVLSAMWLMQAAGHFNNGVRSGDTSRLFEGFRSLRLYLIVYVIWSGVSLLSQLSPFVLLGLGN